MAKHYVYGSGIAGCLYDSGPHCTDTLENAIEALRFRFDDLDESELTEMVKNLRASWIHYFHEGSDAGADYCEITEADGPCPEQDE